MNESYCTGDCCSECVCIIDEDSLGGTITGGLHHAKRSLMSLVVVIPKEGRVRVARPPFFWYDTDFLDISKKIFFYIFFFF